MKQTILNKLTSRKFWAAVASGVLCVVAAAFGEQLTPEMVEILKYAVVAGVAYIFGEGIVDAARKVADVLKPLNKSDPAEGDTDDTETEAEGGADNGNADTEQHV